MWIGSKTWKCLKHISEALKNGINSAITYNKFLLHFIGWLHFSHTTFTHVYNSVSCSLAKSQLVGVAFWFPMKWNFFCKNIFNTLLRYWLYFDSFWNSIHWAYNIAKLLVYEGHQQRHQYIYLNVFKLNREGFVKTAVFLSYLYHCSIKHFEMLNNVENTKFGG